MGGYGFFMALGLFCQIIFQVFYVHVHCHQLWNYHPLESLKAREAKEKPPKEILQDKWSGAVADPSSCWVSKLPGLSVCDVHSQVDLGG